MSTSKRLSGVVFMVAVAIVLIFGNSFPNALSISSLENGSSKEANKVVMINFDDGRKSQLIYAKPILDKYGFKASFFIICGRVGTESSSIGKILLS